MALNFSIPKKTVSLPDGDGGDTANITVRGLSPSDISLLLREDNGEVIGAIYRSMNGATTAEGVAEVITNLLGELPDMIAKIIARAADVPDEWEVVAQIPLGSQYELIEAIGSLTFASESARKKLMSLIAGYLTPAEAGAAPSQTPLLKTSTTGSGDSESR